MRYLRGIAGEGVAVVMISSEIPELIMNAERVHRASRRPDFRRARPRSRDQRGSDPHAGDGVVSGVAMTSPKIIVVGSFAVGLTIRASQVADLRRDHARLGFRHGAGRQGLQPGGRRRPGSARVRRCWRSSAPTSSPASRRPLRGRGGGRLAGRRRGASAPPASASSFSTTRAKTSSSSTWAPTN